MTVVCLQVDTWITEELRYAPAGLSQGWFVSNLEFYDLQDSLSDGTLVAMALSVAVAFSVMLLTTWNVIISIYAILSIAGTIFVTVGSLVLLGWELNILESVTISVAVGLSVDFAVHYGVAYRLAPEPDREGKVIFSLSRMGSAIAMAALTTFVAGAMMMPSTVLAYTQLGTFMMLIMCISWAFATFFFQCMCRCLGPQGTCGQIPLPKKLRCQAFSDDPPATPAGARKYQLDGRGGEVEHYELEPLASRQKSEEQPGEEPEVCAQLYNGLSGSYSPVSGRPGVENGLTLRAPPSRCQFSPTCTCGDVSAPPPPLPQQWSVRPCSQRSSCPPPPPPPQFFPLRAKSPSKQPPPSNTGPVCTRGDCCPHYAHCHPSHFHHCSPERVPPPRQGPAAGCHLRKPCAHAASAPPGSEGGQRPHQDADSAPSPASKSTVHEQSHSRGMSADDSQGVVPPTPSQTQCPAPSPPSPDPPPATSPQRPETRDRRDNERTDVCFKIPGHQETLDSFPVTREENVKRCTKERTSSAPPKKLYCLKRTLKASEFNRPGSDTSLPPMAIHTTPAPHT